MMNTKKVFIGFVSVIAVTILLMTLFGWAAPLGGNTDRQKVAHAIEQRDSVKATCIEFMPLAEVNKNDSLVTYQTVHYLENNTVFKTAFVEVRKGFLKYKFVGLMDIKQLRPPLK